MDTRGQVNRMSTINTSSLSKRSSSHISRHASSRSPAHEESAQIDDEDVTPVTKKRFEAPQRDSDASEFLRMLERRRNRREDDVTLSPNPDVTIHKKDPFFETKATVPFISKYAHSRRVFRAINLHDFKLLEALIRDRGKVKLLSYWRSVSDQTTALHHAISKGDRRAIEMVAEAYYGDREMVADIPADRVYSVKLMSGPVGSRLREGTDALTKDIMDMQRESDEEGGLDIIEHMLKTGVDFDILKTLYREEDDEISEDSEYVQALGSLDLALERGHINLALPYLQDIYNCSHYTFRRLVKPYLKVLQSGTKLKNVKRLKVSRGLPHVQMMSPLHFSACNPDPSHLKHLLERQPLVDVQDSKRRILIHFAAACEGTGPLELLLEDPYAADILAVDIKGNLPIHYAVRATRSNNIELLFKASDSDLSGRSEGETDHMETKAGVNRPNDDSQTPLHLAIETGNLDVVRLLVENGADVNAKTNVTHFKVTPLMMAAQLGFLDMARFLVDKGAVVEQKDRLGRTAVIHAAMNGNTNVLSYLLNLGASPTRCDSSGNSPLHYAAAYGWYFCVKTLLEAGADVNISNDWKITAWYAAYMKGHHGLVKLFLDNTEVDVNYQDDQGTTLVSMVLSANLTSNLYEQIRFLVEEKGALCTLADNDGTTPLHILARNNILTETLDNVQHPSKAAMDISVKIARFLVTNGCDYNAVDTTGNNAVMDAMRSGNVKLVQYLLELASPVLTETDSSGRNILHHLCEVHMDSMLNMVELLTVIKSVKVKAGGQDLQKAFTDMGQVYSLYGLTPLLTACLAYMQCEKTGASSESRKSTRLLWKRGREFVQLLIEGFNSDSDAVVKKEKRNSYFHKHPEYSAADMLSLVGNCEYGGYRDEHEDEYPALRMILEYNPGITVLTHYNHVIKVYWRAYSGVEADALLPRLTEEGVECSLKVARILVGHDCDLKAGDKDGFTAAMIAIDTGNLRLLQLLVEAGCPVHTDKRRWGSTIMSSMSQSHMNSLTDYLAILKYISTQDGQTGCQNLKEIFIKLANGGKDGHTQALTEACSAYNYRGKQGRDPDSRDPFRLLWQRGREFISFLIDGFYGGHIEKDLFKSVLFSLSTVDCCEYGGYRDADEPEYPGLRMLLQYKKNVKNTDGDLMGVALGHAVKKVRWKVVEIMIQEGGADINGPLVEAIIKMAPIIDATNRYMYGPMFQVLVEAGADVRARNLEDGSTALHAVAAASGHDKWRFGEMLLEHGADLNALNNDHQNPLALLVEGFDWSDSSYGLLINMLAAGADVTVADVDGRIPLHYIFTSIRSRKLHTGKRYGPNPIDLCRMVTEKLSPEQVNQQDKYGFTPLHLAAFTGPSVCCMYLIERGADVNLKDNDGNTSLAMALKGRHELCAAVLIQNCADVKNSVVDPDNEFYRGDEKIGEVIRKTKPTWWQWEPIRTEEMEETVGMKKLSVLEFAVKYNLQGICFLVTEMPYHQSGVIVRDAIATGFKLLSYGFALRMLRTSSASSVTKVDKFGRNLLHTLSLTAAMSNTTIEKCVNEMLDKGVSLAHLDDYSCSPLHYAILNHNFTLCMYLLKQDHAYDPKQVDVFNRSVLAAMFWKLDVPFEDTHGDMIHELVSRGGNLDVFVDRPLQELTFGADIPIRKVDYWTKCSTTRVTPLIIVINLKNRNFTQRLLKEGADVNCPDEHGATPVMYAVQMNHLNTLKTLMNFDFDPDAKEPVVVEKPKVAEMQVRRENVFTYVPINTTSNKSYDDSSEEEERDTPEAEKNTQTESGYHFSSDEKASSIEEKMDTTEHEQKDYFEEQYGFKPFTKVSDVNINAVDKDGWTAIHHAVCPLSFGTFDNDETVFILAKAGAKLTVKNKKGETPLDLAVKNGAFRIARMIQELENVPERKMREPQNTKIDVSDKIKWKGPPPSFRKDASKYLASLPPRTSTRPKPEIDWRCGNYSRYENKLRRVRDEEQDLLYDVLLTKSEATGRKTDFFQTITMQLVEQVGDKTPYILFEKKVLFMRTSNVYQTRFTREKDAITAFREMFESLTGTKWTDVKSFQAMEGKYKLVDDEKRRVLHIGPFVDLQILKSKVDSKLPGYLKELLHELANAKLIEKFLSDIQFGTHAMQVGHLQRDEIIKGKTILADIWKIIQEFDNHLFDDSYEMPLELCQKTKEQIDQILHLREEYLQIIPQKGYCYQDSTHLASAKLVLEQENLIHNVLQCELMGKILLGAKQRATDTHPLDYVYRSVGCQIQLMGEEEEEAQYILRYIYSSDKHSRVVSIYRVEREGEHGRMEGKNGDNHRLLFTPVDAANLLATLHTGIENYSRQGIMFIDNFDGCKRYCDNQGNMPSYMMLCEVALGSSQQVITVPDCRPEGAWDSVCVLGRDRPLDDYNIRLKTGYIVPLGKVVNNYYHGKDFLTTDVNRYFVYDEAQVCLRYVIKFNKK